MRVTTAPDVSLPATASALERIEAAQALVKRNRKRGLEALDAIFREGKTPDPALDGRTRGALVALDIAPGLTPLMEKLLGLWLPWEGKTFRAAEAEGDNIVQRSAWVLAHVLWPLYRGYRDDGPRTFRVFVFRTFTAPGKDDPDRTVLKLDYDIPGNPSLSLRRVLDEVTQVGENVYLGKAHVKWWWGRWQRVAFFMLQRTDG